jgi:hypothetical protein
MYKYLQSNKSCSGWFMVFNATFNNVANKTIDSISPNIPQFTFFADCCYGSLLFLYYTRHYFLTVDCMGYLLIWCLCDNILYSAELSSDLEIFILVIMYANRTVQN